ncbi:MAG: hypothetical protein WDM70_09340 [Nitrosomonadales bacterium]
MKLSAIILIVLTTFLTWFAGNSHAESSMNKCTDGNEITYTDKACEKLGLKDAGLINRDAVTIVPAIPVTVVPTRPPQNKPQENSSPPASTDSDAYQCTAYYGIVSYSSTPCPPFSLVRELGYNRPVLQEVISKKEACEKMRANPEASSNNSLSCP